MSVEQSDQQLVERFFEGCEDSFRLIVERYESKVFHTALYLTDDTSNAEHVLQSVFTELHHKLDADFGKTPLFEWLTQYTLDLSVQRLIEQKQEAVQLPNHSAEKQTTTEHVRRFEEANTSIRSALCRAITKLPHHLKFVFLLRDVQGLALTKTANILGLNVFETRARLHQARLVIRRQLAPLVDAQEEQAS